MNCWRRVLGRVWIAWCLVVLLVVPSSAIAAGATRPPPTTPPNPAAVPGPRPTFGGHAALTGTPLPARPDPVPSAPRAPGQAEGATPPSTSFDADGTSLTIAQANCRASASTAADLQAQFDQRGPVWGGADGAEPIPIDQGRTVWLFGDTMVGGGAYGGPLDIRGFVRNSMVVQYDGSCFLYLFRSDAAHNWYSTIADPADQDHYWPQGGAYDAATGVLSIVAARVHADIPNDAWGWRVIGIDVIRYRMNPVMTRIGSERLFTYGAGDRAQFGNEVMVDQGRVYFHGCAQTAPTECFVARTDLAVHSASLQYRSGSGWVSNVADADPVDLEQPVGSQLHVEQVGDGYVASNQVPLITTETWAWWSPTVSGPFRPIGQLFDARDLPLHSNWFTYGGREITTSAGAIGVFLVNTFDAEAFQVTGVYGPRFVTLPPDRLDAIPFGRIDRASPLQTGTHLVGWAIDPGTTDPVQLRLSTDGAPGPLLVADLPRPDVEAEVPGFGPDHGFDTLVALGPGVHRVCLTAVNLTQGKFDRVIGCASVGPSGPASTFHPVDPVRILDSRSGAGGFTTSWSPDQTRSLTVAGVAGVPTTATAVVVNVTVTDTSAPGFLTVAPTGGQVPNASNLNFVARETATNLVTAQVGTGGRIDITSTAARANVVADLVGYYDAGGGDLFVSLPPERILDSRTGTGGSTSPWGPGEQRELAVAGRGPVPSGATAVVLNVTATDVTDESWLQVSPSGRPPNLTSNLNVVPGETVANLVVVELGDDGGILLTNHRGHVDVVADVAGYFTPAGGGRLVPLAPVRILDSRTGTGGYHTPWPAGTRSLEVGGIDPVPSDATAVVVNVTVTETTATSLLRVSPTGQPPATTSNLNFVPGQTIPNLVVVRLGTGGRIDIANLFGTAQVIVDLVGYYRSSA